MACNIIYLYEIPVSSWHYKRLGVALLKMLGHSIHIFDCTRLIKPAYYSCYRKQSCNSPDRYDIGSQNDLKDAFKKINHDQCTIIFDGIGFSKECNLIRSIVFRDLKNKRGVINVSIFPESSISILRRLKNQTQRNDFIKRAVNRGRRFFTEKLLNQNDLVMLSGRLSEIGYERVPHKIFAHSFDYDEYMEVENSSHAPVIQGQYIAYLDEGIIGHPDLMHGGYNELTKKSTFYKGLNDYFSSIEDKHGVPVVVAAHPKSDVQDLKESTHGRLVLQSITPQIVKHSLSVIGHASASLNFAALWNKHVSIITNGDLENSYLGPLIKARAKSFGVLPVAYDRAGYYIPKRDDLFVDVHQYEHFIHDYLKLPNTPNLPAWKIFSDYINAAF